MENQFLVTYKWIWFMSTLIDYTDYELATAEIMQRKVDTGFANIIKGSSWIAKQWPGIAQCLTTGNIYLMGVAPLAVPSSREV